MQYGRIQIKLRNTPELENIADRNCCRTYHYLFRDKLPEQQDIDRVAKDIGKRFYFSKDAYEIPEDVEIHASIIIKRLDDQQAQVIIVTTQPEESCVYMFGIYRVPLRLESLFGTVQSIQGQPREMWID